MKFNNFGETTKERSTPHIETTMMAAKEEGNGTEVLRHARDRWLEIMKGKRVEKDGERIDFEKIIPDIRYFFGEQFNVRPGTWWMTETTSGKKTLYYPRQYGIIPNNVSPEEKETQIKIQGGGILHEMGHHAGVVKALEAMMREADTTERILGDLSLGETTRARIAEEIKGQREKLERLGLESNLGPHVGNLMFLHDLENVCLDIWLEAYLSRYPNERFANEAYQNLGALNRALFTEIPNTLTGELLADQLKSALLLKAMRPDLMEKDGGDMWFQEDFVAPEVAEALRRIKKDRTMEKLTDSEELSGIFMPEERLRWVKRKKLQEAYFVIRHEFVNLLKKDFERALENMKQKQKPQSEKTQKGEGGQGSGEGEQQQKGEKQEDGDNAQEGKGKKERDGKNDKGKSEKPTSFDDLSAEQQAELINNFLDQIQNEEIGSGAMSEEEVRENEALARLSREAINQELQNRRNTEEEAERRRKGKTDKDKENEKGDKNTPEEESAESQDRSDTEKSTRDTQRVAMKRGIHEAQRHATSEMERGAKLGLSPEHLHEFEQKKAELDRNINYFRDELIKLFNTKLEPERKTHRTEGHLMSGHFSDYLRAVSRGEEPRTFEHLSFTQVIPSIDLLFLVDHSGSMEGRKISVASEAVLLFGEALLRAEKIIETQHGGGRKKREFLREGLITFSDTAILQKPLDEQLDDKSVAALYFRAKELTDSGGTADAKALKNLINYLKEEAIKYHRKQKVMNIVVILSDGQGEKGEVQNVLKTAAELPSTLFVAVGVGTGTQEMLDTWKGSYGQSVVVPMYIPDEKLNTMPQEIITGIQKELRKEFAKL